MKRIQAAIGLLTIFIATLDAQSPGDPWPKTIDEFRAGVQRVLTETGVPGAGVALVRTSGIEWAGGIGLADRDSGAPVTADTRFRAGSMIKTFIAMTLAQMDEDDEIDLNATVAELAPEVQIDNAWELTDPVRVIHLLQHTAGFDDTHFNEVFGTIGAPELPLADVLRFNPASRVVRWRPGTRMSVLESRIRGRWLHHRKGQRPEVRRSHCRTHFHAYRHDKLQPLPPAGRPREAGQGLHQPRRRPGTVHAGVSTAGRQPAHHRLGHGEVRAHAPQPRQDCGERRRRSGVPEQYGASADDPGVRYRIAHGLRIGTGQLRR